MVVLQTQPIRMPSFALAARPGGFPPVQRKTLFQPHRISRFTTLYEKFKEALKFAEPLIILPIFTAGEKISGKTSKELYNEMKAEGYEVYYFDSYEDAGKYLKENISLLRIKALVTVGAGDLNKVFNYLK